MLLNSKIIPLDIDINTKLVIDFAIIKISISIGDVRIISNPLFSNSLLIDLLIPSIIEKLREIQKIIEKISDEFFILEVVATTTKTKGTKK